VLLVLIVSLQGLSADPDTTGGILKDDPILAALDSMATASFFEANNFTTDTNALNFLKWNADTIPQFTDAYYTEVFKEMDANTPFNMVYNKAVRAYIDAYAIKNRSKISRMLGLAELYFPLFEETLDRFNLPLELKYLAIVESALKPTAKSRSGAMGLWQFMYRTGEIYNLHSTSYLDDRRDPYKATVAACQYFELLYSMFNDWQMVLAAYNGGPGNLLKAIRRAGGKRDYWEVRPFLSKETQGYVPAFFAVNYVMTHAAEHNLYPVKPAFFSYELDTVIVRRYTNMNTLAKALEMPLSQIRFLNPIFKQSIIPQTKNGLSLILPKEKIGIFLTNEDLIYQLGKEKVNMAYADQGEIMKDTKTTHKVKRGETLGGIAAKYRFRVSDLRSWNRIRGNLISVGQRLVVYSRGVKKSTTTTTVRKTSSASKTGRYHTVQKGDTLWGIAKENGISVAKLKELNRISNDYRLKIGSKLKI